MRLYLKRCLAAWIVATATIQGTAGKAQVSADAAELSRLENVWNEAHVRGDAAALDRLWAEDLTVTVPNMPVITRENAIGIKNR
jgi:ketosteroid isomerase-like protein